MLTRGHITLEDFTGTQTTVIVERVKSYTDTAAIADFLAQHSEAKVVNYKFEQIAFVTDDIANNSGAYDTVEQSLNLTFRVQTSGDYVYVVIPAPGEHTLNDHQENESLFAAEVKALLENTTSLGTLLYRRGGLNSTLPIDS